MFSGEISERAQRLFSLKYIFHFVTGVESSKPMVVHMPIRPLSRELSAATLVLELPRLRGTLRRQLNSNGREAPSILKASP